MITEIPTVTFIEKFPGAFLILVKYNTYLQILSVIKDRAIESFVFESCKLLYQMQFFDVI
jgi:hypothetical protein